MRNALILIGLLLATACAVNARPLADDKSGRKPLEFRLVSLCDYIDQEATRVGFRLANLPNTHLGCSQLLASDGEELFVYDGQFPTAEEAKRYLNWKEARYFKILSRGAKTNRKGEKVGYRLEMLVDADHKQSAVMWTNGSMFYQIIAKSLADAEELEKR